MTLGGTGGFFDVTWLDAGVRSDVVPDLASSCCIEELCGAALVDIVFSSTRVDALGGTGGGGTGLVFSAGVGSVGA
jgi:hypothetical protein